LRARTLDICETQYQGEYDQIFKDFEDKKLPRDELYFKVKGEIDEAERKKKFSKKLTGKPVLPNMN